MANYGGRNFTGFSNVNLKGSGEDPGVLRTEVNGFAATVSVSETYADQALAWSFPAKSGTFPIMGTFRVQLPATSTSVTLFSTAITVSGIRTEDAVAVFPNKGASAGYSFTNSGGTARALIACEAGDGQIVLTFQNTGTTGYVDQIYSYLAMR